MNVEFLGVAIFEQIMDYVVTPCPQNYDRVALQTWMSVCKFWRQFAFDHVKEMNEWLCCSCYQFPMQFTKLQSLSMTISDESAMSANIFVFPKKVTNLCVKLDGINLNGWWEKHYQKLARQLTSLQILATPAKAIYLHAYPLDKFTNLKKLALPTILQKNYYPPNLEYLSVNIPKERVDWFLDLNLTKLTSLTFGFYYPGQLTFAAQAISHLTNIKHLAVINTNLVSANLDFEIFPHLQSISLQRCVIPSFINLDRPALTRLVLIDIVYCLESYWINLPIACPNLKTLVLLFANKFVSQALHIPRDNYEIPLAYIVKSLKLDHLELNQYCGEDLRPSKHIVLHAQSPEDFNEMKLLYNLKGAEKITIKSHFAKQSTFSSEFFFPLVQLFDFIRPPRGLRFRHVESGCGFQILPDGQIMYRKNSVFS